jgi:prepilin-type N-terminal cleavage/methylation domain-containing protein
MICTVKIKYRNSGFTLIELLVVIAIIGILASVVLASLNQARTKARDAGRIATLGQIQRALELYRNTYGTYLVLGSGYSDAGQGWFAYEGGPYTKAVSRKLYEEGLLAQPIVEDPLISPSYMIYLCNSGNSYSLFATLENPSPEHITNANAVCAGSYVAPTYGKNYAVTSPD